MLTTSMPYIEEGIHRSNSTFKKSLTTYRTLTMVRFERFLLTFILLTSDYFGVNHCLLRHEIVTNLHQHILEKYDEDVCPLENLDPLTVNVSLSLLRIRNFNEVEEILQTSGLFVISWTDLRLSWNQTRFGNISQTAVKQKDLWIPEITIVNAAGEIKPLGNSDIRLSVHSSGLVKWGPAVFMDTVCAMGTKYFPFDEQACTIDISTGRQVPDKILLVDGEFHAIGNIHWELTLHEVNTDRCMGVSKCIPLKYKLTIRRRSNYYISTLLLPILAVSVLTAFSFLVPRNSGEKLGYSITIFLAYMVLLPFITERLPRTTNGKPLLISYISSMLVFAMVSVMWSVLSAFVGECCSRRSRDKTSSGKPEERVEFEAQSTQRQVKGNQSKQLDHGIAMVNASQHDLSHASNRLTRQIYERMLNAFGDSDYQNGGMHAQSTSFANEPDDNPDNIRSMRDEVNKRTGKQSCRIKHSLGRFVRYLDLAMFILVSLVIGIMTTQMIVELMNNKGSDSPHRWDVL